MLPQIINFEYKDPVYFPVPCAPGNVSASLICENHSVLVTWSESPTAVNYTVTVTDQDGQTHHCHNDTSSCVVPDLLCGQVYNITVTSHSTTCTGLTSDVYVLKAGVCCQNTHSRCLRKDIKIHFSCFHRFMCSYFTVSVFRMPHQHSELDSCGGC